MFPFWGVAAKDSMPFVQTAVTKYQYRKEDFELVDAIHNADYVFIPYQYDRLKAANPELLARIIRDAEEAKKPLLIDGAGDIEPIISDPRATILRVSRYSYTVTPRDITVPFPTEDLLVSHKGGVLKPHMKPERPSVSFTGWAGQSFSLHLRTVLKELPVTLNALVDSKRGAEHKGILFRARALKALAADPRIETHFTARKGYSGHIATMQAAPEVLRKEFVDALDTSDYALCVRGDANASVRFYEALSLGKIPLFVDTACVLPLEDIITYRDFCVFVDWRDVDRIDEILLKFHSEVTSEQFVDMQRKARQVYENYLRTDAFSPYLRDMLASRIVN
jgi:hypothetical protein